MLPVGVGLVQLGRVQSPAPKVASLSALSAVMAATLRPSLHVNA